MYNKTSDGGDTWKPQTAEIYPWAVSAVDSNIAWVVGWNFTIMKTTNGGRTWVKQYSVPTTDVIAI